MNHDPHKPLRDEPVRHLLLVALYQLQYGKSAPYAVVDHAVRAVRKIHAGAAGLANAVLRQFLREREALLAEAAASDAGRYSYPQWWIDEIRADYGAEADAILRAGNQHPPMTLRVNRRRMDCAAYQALLAAQGMEARQVGEEALLLARLAPVEGLPGFREGVVSVQDAGAQRAAPKHGHTGSPVRGRLADSGLRAFSPGPQVAGADSFRRHPRDVPFWPCHERRVLRNGNRIVSGNARLLRRNVRRHRHAFREVFQLRGRPVFCEFRLRHGVPGHGGNAERPCRARCL